MHRIPGWPRAFVSSFLALSLAAILLATAPPALATPPAMVPGEVLVKFKSDASPSEIRAIMDDLGATRIKRFHRIHAEQDRITRYTVVEAVDRYKHHSAIEFIEPNYIVHLDAVPNDNFFGQQWSLQNTGQLGGTPGADIDATLAWDQETGSPDVVVAIIDSGTDYNHPDLAANIWTNPGEIPGNGLDDDGNGFVDDVHGYDFVNVDSDPMDDNGHGTHTAGTVAAVGNNGTGVAGVAWHAKIMPLKFLSSGGSGPISAAVQCVEYATMMGASIMNNSWGGGGYSQALEAAIQDADAAGILFVAAAGNASGDLDQFTFYPASYTVPNLIAVASTTNTDALSSFSNFGAHTVHLAAPGSSIISTMPGGGYQVLSGTSMAAPHVCGALALLKSHYPSMPASVMKTVLLTSVDLLPSLNGVVITGGRLNASRMLEGLDSVAPDPIADLSVASALSNRVVLRWTATGDDAHQGSASRYDVRYSVGPIDESNFDLATAAAGSPTPAPAGTLEEMTVSGLEFNAAYYFAVKAMDEYGNESTISNVVTGTTQGAPDIAFSPASLSQSLVTGAVQTQTLTLSNLGVGSLDFSVTVQPALPAGNAQPSLALAKGQADPRIGDPVTQGHGGPDIFGHRWEDSDHPGGPSFQWVDISSVGVPVSVYGDDQISSPIPMGFSFPYFDNSYSEVRVCTNGFLSFTSSQPLFTNQPLPSASAPENMIAPFWDDLIVDPATVYAHFDGTEFIVQWNGVYHYGGGGPYTFEAILRRDGTIVYQYQSMASPVNSATVGIQNGQASDGLTVAFNTPYVHDGLAVRIVTTPLWLSASPVLGTVLAGQQAGVGVRFNAAGLDGGEYDAALQIASNDPDETSVLVPVHLHVDPAPDIATGSPTLDFGVVFTSSTGILSLQVANEGVAPLSITTTSAQPVDYEVDDIPLTLAPGAVGEIEVRFSPSRVGPIPGSLTIVSNDPDEGVLTIPLAGAGLVPPDISVAPASLSSALLTGQTDDQTFAIANSGGSDLVVSLSVRGFPTIASGPGPVASGPASGSSRDTGDNLPTSARTGVFNPNASVLVIQDTQAWGVDMGTFLVDRFGITPTVISSSQIGVTNFAAFDLIITVGDESASYYSAVSANAAKFTAFVSAGGVVQYQLATQGSDVSIADNVLVRYGGFEFQNRVVLPSHPIVAGLPTTLEGDYANHCYITQLPPDAKIITETFNTHLPTTVEYKIGAGTVLVTGMTWEYLYLSSYNSRPMLVQATDYSLSLASPRWLQVSPESARIPAGATAQFHAVFDAARLLGGTYEGVIDVRSNDPDEPAVTVSAHLQVTGAPDIALSQTAHDFGSLFLTTSENDSLLVTNEGTDNLSVTGIDIDDTDFYANPSTFDLSPGQQRLVILSFAPTRTGAIHGTVTVHSNDPDEASLTVALTGAGLEPPDIAVTPNSFDEALLTGESVTRALTVANQSGSDLDFEIAFEPADQSAPQGGTGPAAQTRIHSWSEDRQAALADTTGPPPGLPEVVPLALPVVIHDPPSDGGSVDLVNLRGGVRQGSLEIEMETSTTIVPTNFGGYLSLDVDQNRNTGYAPSAGNPYQDIGAEYEFYFFSLASGVVWLVNIGQGTIVAILPVQIDAHTLRFAAPLALFGGDDGRMDVTGVIGTASGPTDWFPNVGHGTLGGVDWLAASPAHGTVTAGSSIDVTLTFDAGSLDGGQYDAKVVVSNNDPDESRVEIPARLRVTGAPLISVQPAALDFGSPFLGVGVARTVTVFNVGSDQLVVTNIESTDQAYTVNSTGFSLAPHTSRVVTATFATTVAGDHSAVLRLTHNASGSPTEITLHGVGVPPPVITVSPASFASNLESGHRETQPLTIGNTGGSDLAFNLNAESNATEVLVQEALDVPRGTEDPRHGDPVTEGRGGPDGFGYRWTDSDQPGGPVFDWVEIRGIGTRIPMRNLDDNYGPLPVGFEFPFYGSRFTQFRICTHGWISFTSSAIQYVNQPLPSAGAPENLLAAFWDDLNFSGVERAYYYNDGTRLIIQYTDVPSTSGGGPFTFEIILYPSGAIVYQYLSMASPTAGATIGIQNGLRNDGLQIVFNAPYVHNQMAIRISAAPSWLTLSPLSGTVPPAGVSPIDVTTDATGLFPGDYPARINVSSNDPVNPLRAVPVALHVVGIPHLATSPAVLEYDTLFVGQTQTRILRLTNVGTDRLNVSGISSVLPDFTTTPTTLSLAPLQSTTVSVSFVAGVAGDRGTELVIVSNDPATPARVPIRAVTLVPPVLSIEPATIVAAVPAGGSKQKTLHVLNSGGSDLRWAISIPILSGPGAAVQPSVASEAEKGDTDPRAGILGDGGPDLSGHVWIDSDNPSGPQFDWIDIATIGTRIAFTPNADDENQGPFPIGFSFPFYGNQFQEFRVCTNGWISFTSNSTRFFNEPLPSHGADMPGNLLAVLWDDMLFRAAYGSSAYYYSDGQRLIVQWDNLNSAGPFSPTNYSFEAILSSNGTITYQYLSLGSNPNYATVGIQDALGDDGLTVVYNTAYLHPNLAVRITQSPRWLSIQPRSGVVPAGGSADLTVTFDAAALDVGDFNASVPFTSNQPNQPAVAGNFLLHVGSIAAADEDIDPNSLNLGSNGHWIAARVELPEGYDLTRVVHSTVRLLGAVPADGDAPTVTDFNHNQIPDLEYKFDRAAVEAILPEGEGVPLTITGEIEDTVWFTATELIRVIRPHVTSPNGGESFQAGTSSTVHWEDPQGWHVDHADITYSLDGGGTWSILAQGVAGNSLSWFVPNTGTSEGLVRVYIYDDHGVMGFDTSDNAFTIRPITTGVEAQAQSLPKVFALYQNLPNPFNPATEIRFDMPISGRAAIRVYGVDGRLVRAWELGALPAGRHHVRWDGRNGSGGEVASGIYFYRLKVEGANRYEASRRMMMVK